MNLRRAYTSGHARACAFPTVPMVRARSLCRTSTPAIPISPSGDARAIGRVETRPRGPERM